MGAGRAADGFSSLVELMEKAGEWLTPVRPPVLCVDGKSRLQAPDRSRSGLPTTLEDGRSSVGGAEFDAQHAGGDEADARAHDLGEGFAEEDV
ncbi:hypothetical protein GCM10010420_12560 [Streptomyces glaucosporus]|uniref:Transposase n=1 Tax=Streptomyces glaucosporus TaxID=284044 RepID=A0ABN3HXR2_9ACTN